MSKPTNSRRDPRIGPLLVRADFWFADRLCRGYLTNLSGGGGFLATREQIPVGTAVRMLVTLPWYLGQIEVEGTVVWRRAEQGEPPGNRSGGVGVQFSPLSPAASQKLDSYLGQFRQLAARLPDRAAPR